MIKALIKPFLIFALIGNSALASIDIGDGSDGSCDLFVLSPINTSIQNIYNCTDVSSSGAITITGTSPLIIKSLYDVTISNSINISGANGVGQTGGSAIAGGYDGGDNASNGQGLNALTRGLAGGDADPTSLGENGGGGGSGGAGTTLGTTGQSGIDDGSNSGAPGAGGSPTSQTYNSPLSLSINTTGGSGGGGGGTSAYFGGAGDPGGAGGAGGGVLMIFSGSNININASISANGGNGVQVTDSGSGAGGSGGGGAGGAIFIRAQEEVTISASISAIGGNGGAQLSTGFSTGGAGGNGGDGVIRIDDSDGVITGVSNTTPTASSYATSTSSVSSFKSSLSPGCVLRENQNDKRAFLLLTFILGLAQVILNRQEIKKACRAW